MIGDNDIRKSLREVAEFLRSRAEFPGYGMYATKNPHDFHPDHECCTSEEIARHQASCDAYDKGETIATPPTFTEHATREAAAAYAKEAIEVHGAASAGITQREDGSCVVRCHVGGWGMGSYTEYDDEMLAMATRLDALAGDMPDHDDEAGRG